LLAFSLIPIMQALLIGVAISVLANRWFLWAAFRPKLKDSVQKMLIAFYIGVLGKWILTALLFLLAFKQFVFLASPINAGAMISAFALTQIAQAMLHKKPEIRKHN
jgi:ATP synthase protein I